MNLAQSTLLILLIIVSLADSLKIGLIVDSNETTALNAVQQSITDHDSSQQIILEISSNCSMDWDADLILDYSKISSQCPDQLRKLLKLGKPLVTIFDETNLPVNLIDSSSVKKGSFLPVRSPLFMISISYRTFIEHYSLSNLLIFVDYKLELNMSQIIGSDNETLIAVNIFNIDEEDEFKKMLRKVKKSNFTNFMILGSARSINFALNMIQESDMYRTPYNWYTLSKSKAKIKCVSCAHGKFINGQPVVSLLHDYEGNASLAEDTLETIVDEYFYYDLTRLVLFALDSSAECQDESCFEKINQTDNATFIEKVAKSSLDYMGRFGEWIIKTSKQNQLEVSYQALTMRLTRHNQLFNKIERNSVGYLECGEPNGLIMQSVGLQSEKPRLRIATIVHPPYVMKRASNGTNDNSQYYGFLVDIFEELKKAWGPDFPDYEITEVPSGLYGVANYDDKTQDIRWAGASELFYQNEVDFGLIGMTMLESREAIMTFTEPIFDYVGISVMMKKPNYPNYFFVYLTVLESDVWICILASYFVTSIIMAVFDYYSPYSLRNTKKTPAADETRIFTFKETLWFCFTSLTPQGGGEAPRALSGRLVAATWWLFGFITVASYTANLAAFLTVARLERIVTSFDDMTRQYRVRYNALEQSSSDEYFKLLAFNEDRYYEIWKDLSLNESLSDYERAQLAVWDYPISDMYTKIWAQMHEKPRSTSFENALRRVRDSPSSRDGFALVGERPYLLWAEIVYCDIIVIDSALSFRPIAFPIAKEDSFGLKAKFDSALRMLKDSGKFEKIRYKYWEGNPKRRTCPEWRRLSNGISMKNFNGVMIIIAIGLFLTALFISFENLIITSFKKLDIMEKESEQNPSIPKPQGSLVQIMKWLK